jgi:hypothetical protein
LEDVMSKSTLTRRALVASTAALPAVAALGLPAVARAATEPDDAHQVGQEAAAALAGRVSGRMQTEITIPEQPGQDWNDVLPDGGR